MYDIVKQHILNIIVQCVCSIVRAEREYTVHLVGEAFYNGELENELRRIGKIDYLFKRDSDREKCMEVVKEVSRASLYSHLDMDCTDDCKKRD